MISHKTHNIGDFIFGLTFIFLPLLSGLGEIDAARNAFWAVGALIIFYSVMTKYSYSFLKAIPMKYHLVLDVLGGIFLTLAPTFFSYRDLISTAQYGIQIFAGLLLIGFVGISKFPRDGESPYSKTVLETGHFSFHNRS